MKQKNKDARVDMPNIVDWARRDALLEHTLTASVVNGFRFASVIEGHEVSPLRKDLIANFGELANALRNEFAPENGPDFLVSHNNVSAVQVSCKGLRILVYVSDFDPYVYVIIGANKKGRLVSTQATVLAVLKKVATLPLKTRPGSRNLLYGRVDEHGDLSYSLHEMQVPYAITPGLSPDLDIDLLVETYIDRKESFLILFGPPGTGKTRVVKELMLRFPIKRSAEDRANVIYVRSPRLLEGDSVIYKLESIAKDCGSALLVLDDFPAENLAGSASNELVANLLSATAGIFAENDGALKIVISTNQMLTTMHPALLREGRCADVVYMGPMEYAYARDLAISEFGRTAEEFAASFPIVRPISQAEFVHSLDRRSVVSRPYDKKHGHLPLADKVRNLYSIDLTESAPAEDVTEDGGEDGAPTAPTGRVRAIKSSAR